MSRPRPRGQAWGSGWGWWSPGPHPGGCWGGGFWSGGGLQAHTQGGFSRPRPGGVSQHALRQTATAAGGTHPTGMHSI